LDSDSARDQAADALASMRDQLADIAAMQKKRVALKVGGQAAEGTVEVTVNAQGQLVKTVIDKSYLDDHDFEDLGGYVTEAAQAAAGEAGRRVAEMAAPLAERRRIRKLPSFSDIVEGLSDPDDLMQLGLDTFAEAPSRGESPSDSSAGAIYDDGDGGAEFPTVRR
jgi:DNA-binding protein YbaB